MRKLFLSISGLFGAMPGFAIMFSGLGTPPKHGLIFGGVVEAFGSLTLLLLWINREKIAQMERRKVVRIAIILGVLSFIFLTSYIYLFGQCVISTNDHGTIYFPLWSSGDLAELITYAGGRHAAVEKIGYTSILEAVQAMPPYAMAVTNAVLLFVYQGIFTTLASAFAVIGFHANLNVD